MKQALRLLTGSYFRNREAIKDAETYQLQLGVDFLLRDYVVIA